MSELQIDTKIKELAKSKDLSIRQLCQRVNVTEAGLAFSLKNDTLKIGLLQKIADELGVEIGYFFQSEDKQKERSFDFMKEHWADLVDFLKDLKFILANDKISRVVDEAYMSRRDEMYKKYQEISKQLKGETPSKESKDLISMDIRFKIDSLLVFWEVFYMYIYEAETKQSSLNTIAVKNKRKK
jgi:transcriptional regulator with XRE-family HTH domain